MDTGIVFNRRRNHNNTPKSLLLILANFATVLVDASLFTSCHKIYNFFWVVIAGLVVYNYFNVRRYRDEYNKPAIIIYIVSCLFLIAFFAWYIISGQNC